MTVAVTLDTDATDLARIMSQPKEVRKISSDRFGYYSLILVAADAYDEVPERDKPRLARFICELYGWMLYDPEYPPASDWSDTLWENYHRFYRPGAWEVATRLHNLAFNRMLESKYPKWVFFVTALVCCVTLPVTFLLLWPFPEISYRLGRWLDVVLGPVTPVEWN